MHLRMTAFILLGVLPAALVGDLGLPSLAEAKESQERPAALIIDDVGEAWREGVRSIELPAPVTISVLPHTPYSRDLAQQAHKEGREVMVHLPMEAIAGLDPGPGALFMDMREPRVRETVAKALEAVPHARGVNNHMGSLLTRHPGHMAWLMDELAKRDGLYFIDSRTSSRSVAQHVAEEHDVENAARAVFLDPQRDSGTIAQQFERFVELAQEHSGVIAIGHPYPETLSLLERELPHLDGRGVEIVPASRLVDKPATHILEEPEP